MKFLIFKDNEWITVSKDSYIQHLNAGTKGIVTIGSEVLGYDYSGIVKAEEAMMSANDRNTAILSELMKYGLGADNFTIRPHNRDEIIKRFKIERR